jgi:DNA primase
LAEILSPERVPEKGYDELKPIDPLDEAIKTLSALKAQFLENRQREIRAAIAEAERRGDHAMLDTLLLEKIRVTRSLRELDAEHD